MEYGQLTRASSGFRVIGVTFVKRSTGLMFADPGVAGDGEYCPGSSIFTATGGKEGCRISGYLFGGGDLAGVGRCVRENGSVGDVGDKLDV